MMVICYNRNFFPTIITHKSTNQFGFYSGLVSQLEELLDTYPNIFNGVDECLHKKERNPTMKK